jgi:L-lactate dehydrogenase (cytochrome)
MCSLQVALPFFACPTAGNRMFHNDGELGVAAASKAHGTVYTLSTLATCSIDDIGQALPAAHPKVFQMCLWRDRELMRDLMQQSKEAGFQALALTVDFSW